MNQLVKWLPLLLLAVLWEALPRLGVVDPRSFPPLTDIAAAFAALIANGELPRHLGASLLVLASGLGLAILVGIPLGVLMAVARPWTNSSTR